MTSEAMVASPTVGVVVPAAGSGRRLGGAPKQYRMLGDAPVLVQTLRAFVSHPEIARIAAVVSPGDEGEVGAQLASFGLGEVAVVAGGATRQASVGEGLAALGTVDLVLVHDAARPFVSAGLISDVIAAAHAHGAAAAALPVADTLRQGGDGPLFGATVPRDGLWAMQTPQGARLGWLRRAYGHTRAVATDEAGLLQAVGYAVRIVPGDARNRKITEPTDWTLAQALWPAWTAERDARERVREPGEA